MPDSLTLLIHLRLIHALFSKPLQLSTMFFCVQTCYFDQALPPKSKEFKASKSKYVSLGRMTMVDNKPLVFSREDEQSDLKVFPIHEYVAVQMQQLLLHEFADMELLPWDAFHLATKAEICKGYTPILPARNRRIGSMFEAVTEKSPMPSGRPKKEKQACIVCSIALLRVLTAGCIGVHPLGWLPEQDGAPKAGSLQSPAGQAGHREEEQQDEEEGVYEGQGQEHDHAPKVPIPVQDGQGMRR
jgi:hypothetical protein